MKKKCFTVNLILLCTGIIRVQTIVLHHNNTSNSNMYYHLYTTSRIKMTCDDSRVFVNVVQPKN